MFTALVGCTSSPGSVDDDMSTDDPATSGPTSASTSASDTTPYQCEGGIPGTGAQDSSGDGSMGIGDDMPLVAFIPDVRQGDIARATWVLLEDVVVISPKVASESSSGSEFFVQDQAGGAWSGLRVRTSTLATVPAEGEAVDIVGRVFSERDIYYVQVVIPDEDIVPLGPGVIPPPTLVPIDDLAIATAVENPYEGIGIRVEQVAVTDDDPCDGEFVIEDIARVDDRFVPGQLPAPTAGSMLSAVEGVLVYAEDSLEIAPSDPALVG